MRSLKEKELHLYWDREQHPSTFHKRIEICNEDVVLLCDPNLLTLYPHPVLKTQEAMPADSKCISGLTAPLPFQSCTIPVWTVGAIAPQQEQPEGKTPPEALGCRKPSSSPCPFHYSPSECGSGCWTGTHCTHGTDWGNQTHSAALEHLRKICNSGLFPAQREWRFLVRG